MNPTNIYQFNLKKLDGEEINLSDYKDKVLLIVNTASGCGFTPQLADMVELKKQFAGQPFEILAIPSNDFGNQEPLNGEAIAEFCANYGRNFPLFNKEHVRGYDAHPLYKYLADKRLNGKLTSVPRWNFHKFLIDANGRAVDFFFPFTKPTAGRVKRKISRLLGKTKLSE